MLSILIPTYNYNCIPLLESLLQCKNSINYPIEILVCNDASTQTEVVSKVKHYCSAKKIHYLENSTNKGRTATRSVLANKAQFDWLLFLDADVLPVSLSFLNKFEKHLQESTPIIIGGIAYEKQKPLNIYMLRWKFGRKREARPASVRNSQPYLFASANLLIQKSYFIKANSISSNLYGVDALFSYHLRKQNIPIAHIDNPVYHLGLETNNIFLQKSLAAIDTLYSLEKETISNHTRLQQFYQKIKKIGLTTIFSKIIGSQEKNIKSNLEGSKPSLFLFDIYRLYHYIKLKSDA